MKFSNKRNQTRSFKEKEVLRRRKDGGSVIRDPAHKRANPGSHVKGGAEDKKAQHKLHLSTGEQLAISAQQRRPTAAVEAFVGSLLLGRRG